MRLILFNLPPSMESTFHSVGLCFEILFQAPTPHRNLLYTVLLSIQPLGELHPMLDCVVLSLVTSVPTCMGRRVRTFIPGGSQGDDLCCLP